MAGYVGVEACRPCHAAIASTFDLTGMGRAFYPLDETTQVEDFSVRNRLELPGDRLAYEMTSKDGTYRMRQIVLDEDGSEMASVARGMTFVVGSGNHNRSYLTGDGGYLYEMPVCWYPEKFTWDLCPGFESNNYYFMREASSECLFCHNARTPLVEGTSNRYGEDMPHGIDRERCHGPGAEHVAYWKSPPEVMPDRDRTIVNPARLEPDHPDALRTMGTLLLDLRRFDEAATILRRAVRQKPDDLMSLNGLGRALVEAGDEEQAEELFRRAADLAPAHSTPLANLGLLAARQGRHEEAARLLTAAGAREPSQAAIWEALSHSLAEAGRGDEAAAAGRRLRLLTGG